MYPMFAPAVNRPLNRTLFLLPPCPAAKVSQPLRSCRLVYVEKKNPPQKRQGTSSSY